MSSLSTATIKLKRFNTEALNLLLEGREEQAIMVLSHSLAWANAALSRDSDATQTTTQPLLTEVSFDSVINTTDFSACRENFFRLYRNVFIVEDDAAPCRLVELCAVMSFNLALTYQELGLAEGEVQILARARSLYHISLYYLSHCRPAAPPTNGGEFGMDFCTLELAAYNNLGHLYATLNDEDGIVICRQGLSMSLARAQTREVDSGVKTTFFNESLILSDHHCSRLAPAA